MKTAFLKECREGLESVDEGGDCDFVKTESHFERREGC